MRSLFCVVCKPAAESSLDAFVLERLERAGLQPSGPADPRTLIRRASYLLTGLPPQENLDRLDWVLGRGSFDTWEGDGPGTIRVESHASEAWDEGLRARGHEVERSTQAIDLGFGQAHMIGVDADGVLDGASDPRAPAGAAAGY